MNLQHNKTNPTHVLLIRPVPAVNTASDGVRAVVEKVVMQLAISGSELLLLQEQRVVHERQGVEDVKLSSLGEDERVVHELIQASLESGLVEGRLESDIAGVVEQVGDTHDLVSGVVDDGRLEVVEGEEIRDVVVVVLQHD